MRAGVVWWPGRLQTALSLRSLPAFVTESDDASEESFRRLLYLGLGSGLLAFVLPPVMGPVSVYAGIKLFRRHSAAVGFSVMGFGGAVSVFATLVGLSIAGVI